MIPKTYKNQLLEILNNNNSFDSTKFECVDFKNERIAQTYKNGSSIKLIEKPKFSFDIFIASRDSFNDLDVRFNTFSPNRTPTEYYSRKNFGEVIDLFNIWINNHLEGYYFELYGENNWDLIGSIPKSIKEINLKEDKPFTDGEKKFLEDGINEIRNIVKSDFDLNRTQTKLLDERLNYLIESSKNSNKATWWAASITFALYIIYDLTLSQEKSQILIGLFSKIWEQLKGLPL